MSWDCKYKVGKHCNRRDDVCVPGGKGCVLRGKYSFPFKDEEDEEDGKKPREKKD